MKFLKVFTAFIIGIILFILILALSLIFRVESFIEKDLVVSVVKESSISEINNNATTDSEKSFLEGLLKDKASEEVIERIVQNYISYKTNSNYDVSENDCDFLLDYILKHRAEINAASNTNYSEEDIKKAFNYEECKKTVKKIFDNIDPGTEETNKTMALYSKITSNGTKVILIVSIVICIAFVALVNFGFVKCLKILGIDLIGVGVIFSIIYIIISNIQSSIAADKKTLEIIRGINISGFLTTSIIEIVLGIVFLIVYKLLINKAKDEDKSFVQVQDAGVVNS